MDLSSLSYRIDMTRIALPLLALLAIAAGTTVGFLAMSLGPALVAAALLGLVIVRLAVDEPGVMLFIAITVAVVLPFGVIPFEVGPVSLALLELAIIAFYALIAAVLLVNRRERVSVGPELALWFVFAGFLVFAFVLGLGRGYTPQTLHDFAKFGLGIMMFPAILWWLRDTRQVKQVTGYLVVAVTAAAGIGLALYAGGPGLTERVLVRLIPYGYPGARIVRYIEDDPANAMRAVGTNIDPNAFGGILMVGFVLAVGHLVGRKSGLPLGVAIAAVGIIGVAMLLTYSRGAWVGAAAGVGVLLWFQARVWLIPLAGAGVAAVALGLGSGFVERLWLGFTLQDPATRLRLQEYENALEIIRQHPWFGIGFGNAPSLELQTGVSSVYLTIAEQAGLIGLGLFVLLAVVAGWRVLRSIMLAAPEERETLVAVAAAIVAILTVGLVDHYFFNTQYAHHATLLWMLVGMAIFVSYQVERSTQRK